MDNLTPAWRQFLNYLAGYIVILVVLVMLLRVERLPAVLILLWLVGLGGGGALLVQLARLWFGRGDAAISEERMQGYVERAHSYQAKIDRLVKAGAVKTDPLHLEQLHQQIDTWTAAITDLAQRLNALYQDDLICRDIKDVPRAIADLEARLGRETDAVMRGQLENALTSRRQQLEALTQLQTMLKRAEIQIESTVSQLGTIYSQLLTGQSTTHVADYSRLSADVDEEVRQLQDYLETLHEIKLGP